MLSGSNTGPVAAGASADAKDAKQVAGVAQSAHAMFPAQPAAAAVPRHIRAKMVFLGDSGVGKSTLVHRFVNKKFSGTIESTVGAAFLTQTVDVNKSKVALEIWDTAGQERYHSLAPMYYRGAKAAVVAYDITSRQSFGRAKSWVAELKNQPANKDIMITLVGNKTDLHENRQVDADEAAQYATEQGLSFIEASAMTGANVEKLFSDLAIKLLQQPEPAPKAAAKNAVNLKDTNLDPKASTPCCGR